MCHHQSRELLILCRFIRPSPVIHVRTSSALALESGSTFRRTLLRYQSGWIRRRLRLCAFRTSRRKPGLPLGAADPRFTFLADALPLRVRPSELRAPRPLFFIWPFGPLKMWPSALRIVFESSITFTGHSFQLCRQHTITSHPSAACPCRTKFKLSYSNSIRTRRHFPSSHFCFASQSGNRD